MTVYFLSAVRAALKLNGEYVGIIDLFERYCHLNEKDGVFVEVIPEGDSFSENFILDEGFLHSPPQFADLYFTDDEVVVYIKRYKTKNPELKVLAQARFCENLITVFFQGGVRLLCGDNANEAFCLTPDFENCKMKEAQIGGFPVLLIMAGKWLCAISDKGRVIFYNEVQSFEAGASLKIKKAFEGCAAAYAECVFSYDGEELKLSDSKTVEPKAPQEEVLHFAFFESVLYCGDFTRYLSDDLRAKSSILRDYLGDFCDVTAPLESFYKKRECRSAVGLVYPVGKNKYRVKHYAVDIDNGKICNIYPVD